MKGWRLFILASVLAALSPLFPVHSFSASQHELTFPGWPSELDGLKLTQLTLTEREKHFAQNFPGKVALFTDNSQQYIIRWVTQPTRKLHPAADCLKATGCRIKHLPIWQDSNGVKWSAFNAVKNNQTLYVREHIYDSLGNNWTDISAWYWSAALGKTKAPWWVITTIKNTLPHDIK